jgi:hypothetical protein
MEAKGATGDKVPESITNELKMNSDVKEFDEFVKKLAGNLASKKASGKLLRFCLTRFGVVTSMID